MVGLSFLLPDNIHSVCRRHVHPHPGCKGCLLNSLLLGKRIPLIHKSTWVYVAVVVSSLPFGLGVYGHPERGVGSVLALLSLRTKPETCRYPIPGRASTAISRPWGALPFTCTSSTGSYHVCSFLFPDRGVGASQIAEDTATMLTGKHHPGVKSGRGKRLHFCYRGEGTQRAPAGGCRRREIENHSGGICTNNTGFPK